MEFTLKVLFNPLVEAGPYRPYYAMISNVSLSPGNEKRFRIDTREPYILSEAALGSLPIYPEYVYDPEQSLRGIRLSDLLEPSLAEQLAKSNPVLANFATRFNAAEWGREPEKVVGSGPYRLVSWKAGQELRLEKRPEYWGNTQPDEGLVAEPNALVFTFVEDPVTMANGLRNQLFDAVVEPEISKFQELQAESSTAKYYQMTTVPGFKYYALLLNTQDPRLADAATRQALAHLVNVDQIIENFYNGLAQRIVGPILPQKSYYHRELTPLPYDPTKAIQLLAAAGWKDTNGNGTLDRENAGERQELSLTVAAFNTEISQAIALLFQQSAKEVGIEVNIEAQEPRTLFANLNNGDFQMATIGAGSDPNPDDLTQVWSTKSVPPAGSNRARSATPKRTS